MYERESYLPAMMVFVYRLVDELYQRGIVAHNLTGSRILGMRGDDGQRANVVVERRSEF